MTSTTIDATTQGRLAALRRGDLAGIRELRLPGLDTFPEEIFGLADTLEVLDLSGGTLTALPDDFDRLATLRVLFCSGNRFARLPPVLGGCGALSQVGFRGMELREVPGEALPPRLRWLTLTDNRIETLPDALGERPLLQKLMLSGNRLRALPAGLKDAARLELIRLAANRFEAIPDWLGALPGLAWVSLAGNPFEGEVPQAAIATARWADLDLDGLLGEGTSGRVYRASWRVPGTGLARPVALKLFKGLMTSDGLPEREMAACLAAGQHPHLTGAIGRLAEHPEGLNGLLMTLLPADWRVLAGPPSLASCSRDVYDPDLQPSLAAAWRIAQSMARACAHLHATGLMHGDLYGHNILWDGGAGEAVLSDFGAASILPKGSMGRQFQQIEVRAWGLLLGELLDRCPERDRATTTGLGDLAATCIQGDAGARPPMAEICAILEGLRPTAS